MIEELGIIFGIVIGIAMLFTFIVLVLTSLFGKFLDKYAGDNNEYDSNSYMDKTKDV